MGTKRTLNRTDVPLTSGQLCTVSTGYCHFPDGEITEEQMMFHWRRNRAEILQFSESRWPGMKPYIQSRSEGISREQALEACKWPLEPTTKTQ